MPNILAVTVDLGTSTGKGQARTTDGRTVSTQIAALAKKVERGSDQSGTQAKMLLSPYVAVYDRDAYDFRAHHIRNGNIYQQDEYYIQLYGMLADLFELADIPAGDVTIPFFAVGFPCSHLSRSQDVYARLTADRVTIQKHGGRAYRVKFPVNVDYPDSTPKEQRVEYFIAKSQPYFACVDQVCRFANGSGLVFDGGQALFSNGPAAIYHGGSNSKDFAFIPKDLNLGEWDTIAKGTFQLLPAVKEMIYKKTFQNVTDEEAMAVYRTGRYWFEKDYDFAAELPAIVHAYFDQEIREPFRLFLERVPMADKLLLVGGGVIREEPYIREHFAKRFKGGVVMAQDDQQKPEPWLSILRGMDKKAYIEAVKGGCINA